MHDRIEYSAETIEAVNVRLNAANTAAAGAFIRTRDPIVERVCSLLRESLTILKNKGVLLAGAIEVPEQEGAHT